MTGGTKFVRAVIIGRVVTFEFIIVENWGRRIGVEVSPWTKVKVD